MKLIRKTLKWAAGIIIGLMLLLVVLGYLFEDKIHLLAIKELGKALNARIEVQETNVSFLKSWPNLHVELEGLTINPVEDRLPYDIIDISSANFKIDFWSIFSDRYTISEVNLDQLNFHLAVDEEGKLNMADMFRPEKKDSVKSDSSDVVFALSEVRITDGVFIYEDAQSGLDVLLDSIQIDLDGDFSADISEIETEAALRIAHWKDGKMTWARDKHLSTEMVVDARFGEGESYDLKEAKLHMASLDMDISGNVKREGDAYRLDLAYNTNENTFRSFLSLLPAKLLDTGREYEYAGIFRMHGWMRGLAGGGHAPDIHADYSVQDGAFRYLGYDSRLHDIRMKGSYHLEQAQPEASHFKVDEFEAQLQEKPVSGKFSYTNFENPFMAFDLKGDLSLEDIRDFYPSFADSSQLTGNVNVDIQVEGKVKDFQKQNYASVKARGGARLDWVKIVDPRLDYPLEGLTGSVQLDNHHIQVDRLRGKVGSSDFDLRGTVTEYLPWFFEENATIKGIVELQSQTMDLNEWLRDDSPQAKAHASAEDRFVFRLPKNVDFEIRAKIGDFRLASFRAHNMNGRCRLHGNQLKLHHLNLDAVDGSMQVQGMVRVIAENQCEVKIDATINDVDINENFRTFNQLAAFAMVEQNLYGRFSGDVHINGMLNQYLDLDPNSLVSYGTVELKNGKLIDFEPLEGLAIFVKMEELRHIEFSDVRTGFRIDEGFFYIPKMKLTANRYKLEVLGRHGFDNSLDYVVRVEMPRNEAKRSDNAEVLEYISNTEDAAIKVIIPVRITGTVDKPKYRLETQYIANNISKGIKKQGEDLKTGWNEEMTELFGAQDTTEVDDLIEVVEDPADSTKKGISLLDKVKNPFKKLRLGKKFGAGKK